MAKWGVRGEDIWSPRTKSTTMHKIGLNIALLLIVECPRIGYILRIRIVRLFTRLKYIGQLILVAVSLGVYGVYHSVYLTAVFGLCHRYGPPVADAPPFFFSMLLAAVKSY